MDKLYNLLDQVIISHYRLSWFERHDLYCLSCDERHDFWPTVRHFQNTLKCGAPSPSFLYGFRLQKNDIRIIRNQFYKWRQSFLFCYWHERLAFQSVGVWAVDSVTTFPHRRSARIKKLISGKLLRMPTTFEDSVGHFGAPWRPFWILQVVRRSGWDNIFHFLARLFSTPKTLPEIA